MRWKFRLRRKRSRSWRDVVLGKRRVSRIPARCSGVCPSHQHENADVGYGQPQVVTAKCATHETPPLSNLIPNDPRFSRCIDDLLRLVSDVCPLTSDGRLAFNRESPAAEPLIESLGPDCRSNQARRQFVVARELIVSFVFDPSFFSYRAKLIVQCVRCHTRRENSSWVMTGCDDRLRAGTGKNRSRESHR